MKNNNSIILLSGGLDSYVSLVLASQNSNVSLALIFDYGQEVFEEELEASKKIAELYNLKLEVIKLDFLENLLIENSDWVPNRNGLFLNIAACYADKYGYSEIIIGANKEEAVRFSDNSKEFIARAGEFFEYSTQAHPHVLAPLQNMTKVEIINKGLELGIDFSLIKSCYGKKSETGVKHCGVCASCLYLKGALEMCDDKSLIKTFF